MILSTKNKLVLLVAGSLILLAVGVGLFSMYSVKRTMLEEQRRSSVNTVALAAFNVTDRYQILFRSKADQAVALQNNLGWLAKLITTLVHDPSERFKIMQSFPLPEGISLTALGPNGEIRLVRGDLKKDDNPYRLRDIKDRPVGPAMRALAEKGLPATCFVQWDAGGKKQRLYGTHLYLPGEGGLLVGLWANIDKLDEHQQRLKEDSIRELQNEFGKQRIGPSGFLFVTDAEGTPVIGPEGMDAALSGVNPKTGNPLITDIRNAAETPENPVEASISSLISDAPARDALLFVRLVCHRRRLHRRGRRARQAAFVPAHRGHPRGYAVHPARGAPYGHAADLAAGEAWGLRPQAPGAGFHGGRTPDAPARRPRRRQTRRRDRQPRQLADVHGQDPPVTGP